MTASLADSTARRALDPHGLSDGELGANVITTLENDDSNEFATDDGKRVLVHRGTVEVVPVDPKRF